MERRHTGERRGAVAAAVAAIALAAAASAESAQAGYRGGRASAARIDIAETPAGEPEWVASTDWTVAVWYFAAWEPEYHWDGWPALAANAPWRLPLLYDSTDPETRAHGIQYYRNSRPEVLDWHVRWMREYGINLMLWDWYPQAGPDGSLDPSFFGNRALEVGFLGKDRIGGDPVATNRFADTMPFAVMWTNHRPFQIPLEGTIRYTCRQFFSQPNYYRIDGKPLLILFSHHDLAMQLREGDEPVEAGDARVGDYLAALRAIAAEEGHPAIHIALCNAMDAAGAAHLKAKGYDGPAHYNILESGGAEAIPMREGAREWVIAEEDFRTRTRPGHRRVWEAMVEVFGRDYLLGTMPMQDFRPIATRPRLHYVSGASPEAYRELLRDAKAFIEERGLRKFVSIEAWNEWYEGSYIEPGVEWGFDWLEAIRSEFAAPDEGVSD